MTIVLQLSLRVADFMALLISDSLGALEQAARVAIEVTARMVRIVFIEMYFFEGRIKI